MSKTQTAAPESAAPRRHRSPWIWIAAVLALGCAGLAVWAVSLQSDLDAAEQDGTELQAQVEQQSEAGGTLLTGLKAAYDQLAADLGSTQDDLAAAKQDLADAADQARARGDSAQADAQATTARATIAADCARAYVSAFGALFEGESIRAQASRVREELASISDDCQTALAGA